MVEEERVGQVSVLPGQGQRFLSFPCKRESIIENGESLPFMVDSRVPDSLPDSLRLYGTGR